MRFLIAGFVVGSVLIGGAGCKTQSLSYEPTEVKLIGTIQSETFPGPPNYESITNGDQPEDYLILNLEVSFDVVGKPNDEMYPARSSVSKVQLILDDVGGCEQNSNLLNKTVEVNGTLLPGFTVHHKTPVLIRVKKIELVKNTAAANITTIPDFQ